MAPIRSAFQPAWSTQHAYGLVTGGNGDEPAEGDGSIHDRVDLSAVVTILLDQSGHIQLTTCRWALARNRSTTRASSSAGATLPRIKAKFQHPP